MKITSNTISREDFEKMWKDEVENRAYDGCDMSQEGAKLLYVKDDESGVLCCYAQPKKTANAFFVCDVVKRGTQFEVYKTPAGRDHFNIEIEGNDQVIDMLGKIVRPSDKKERQALLNVYKRNCPKKEASHFAVAPTPVVVEEEPKKEADEVSEMIANVKKAWGIEDKKAASGLTEEPKVEEPKAEEAKQEVKEMASDEEIVFVPVVEEEKQEIEVEIEEVKEEENNIEEKNEDDNTSEIEEEKSEKEPKAKKGCLVKLAAAAAVAGLILGAGVVGYKYGHKKGADVGKDPLDTEFVAPGTTEPDNIISGDNIIVDQVEIDATVQDEIYNAIVKNVQVEMTKDEIHSTYVTADNQTVFAMTDTELYKIDLTNGGENLGDVTNNDELITKLQATSAVTESYKIDYLLGDKYVEACKEFEQAYKDENTVTSAQAYVTNISLQKAETGKGFTVAPTTTVVSVDAQGNVSFEECQSDKVTVQRGVQLSGLDMVAASLFTELGFTSDIYTVENVEENSKIYDIAVSNVNETEKAPVVEEPEQTEENVEENTQEPEMTM